MDLIDRQALLKQIEIDSDGEPGYYGDTWKFIDTIKSMPSATDKNVGTKLGTDLAEVGTDCISSRTAIDAFHTNLNELVVGGEENAKTVENYLNRVLDKIKCLPSAQSEIIYCKDCRKHNKKVGFDENFHTVWKEDACPLVDWRGKAKEHEFDYQYCAFAERRTDGTD